MTPLKYTILDLETENNRYLRRFSSPFSPDNFIVAIGWKHGTTEDMGANSTDNGRYSADCIYDPSTLALSNFSHLSDFGTQILVGHNIKFDLLFLWKYEWLQEFFRSGGIIWDTQYAEYMLSAQHPKSHMNALNDVAVKYGGTKKIDVVKEMWESGVKTSDIPQDVLIAYLIGNDEVDGDIGNTEIVFLKQLKKAESMGCLTIIRQCMDSLLATTMMEYNGVFIDTQEARERLVVLKQEHAALQQDLNAFIPELPEGVQFSWSSKQMTSALIFGGAIKYAATVPLVDRGETVYVQKTEKWPLFLNVPVMPQKCQMQNGSLTHEGLPQDVYLSGRKKGEPKFGNVLVPSHIKMKKEVCIFDFPGYVDKEQVLRGAAPKGGWEQDSIKDARGKPFLKTGGDALELLAHMNVPFIKVLNKFMALDKEIGTYYVRRSPKGELAGMLTCVEPSTHIIHHGLNHTSTVTGRLSSTQPNLQNIPRDSGSQVKKMFSSRYGDSGVMIEIDYSQVEVVALGLLSKDENLIRDLNSGIDFHCKRVAAKNGITYEEALYLCKDESAPDHAKWKAERTKCKIFGFQVQYGAGADTIAAETGMTVDEVRLLMQNEKEMYPGVNKFIREVTRAIESTAKPFNDPVRGYRTFRRGWWKSFIGTHYTWRSYDAPAFLRAQGIKDTFSPPEIKNYPVQGTAGDIMKITVGRLFRHFISGIYKDEAVLVNTVHDCIWIDCKQCVMNTVAKDCSEIMSSIGRYLAELYDVVIPVNFPVAVEVGKNMYDLHHWQEMK